MASYQTPCAQPSGRVGVAAGSFVFGLHMHVFAMHGTGPENNQHAETARMAEYFNGRG